MTAIQTLEVEDGAARLVLPSGQPVVFDAADRALVEGYRWYANTNPAGTVYAYGHHRGEAHSRRRWIMMHRLLLDAPAGLDVDHRNGDGLDNRRANLRLATRAQNNANTTIKVGASGYRGVTLNKASGRWQARVWVDGRCRHLGLFADPWEAAQAYNAAAREVWGEFARLNERAAS